MPHFMLLMYIMSSIIMLILTLVGVAFLTLMERKILGLMQIRLGPNKVGFMGIFQPFSDAIKLYTKEINMPYSSNYIYYYFSPIMAMLVSISSWLAMPYFQSILSFNLSMLFLLSVMGMGVYSIMIAGWASNSNYSLLGGLRSVAQTISYEVSLVLIIMSLLSFTFSLNIFMLVKIQKLVWFIIFFPMMFMWFISCLAELNRTPFDFSEGESELVSGFNIEYSSGGFAIIFMAEYCSIMMLSMLTSVMFLGSNFFSLLFYIMVTGMMFSFIWMRATLPRFRYDKLMYLTWKMFLPASISMLGFFMSMSMILAH